MKIDIAVLVLVLLLLIRGIATGAFRYLYRLLGLVAAVFIARYTAPQIAEFIHNNIGISLKTAYSASSLVIIILAAIMVTFIVGWILDPIIKAFLNDANRVLGAIGGLFSGLMFSYILLWLLLMLTANFPNWELLQKLEPESSHSFNFVKSHNYLSSVDFEIMPKLEALQDLAKNPQKMLPADLTDNKLIKDILNSPELLEKLKNGNFGNILDDKQINDLLKNPEVMKKIEEASGGMPSGQLGGEPHN